jgi:hypothetical protein
VAAAAAAVVVVVVAPVVGQDSMLVLVLEDDDYRLPLAEEPVIVGEGDHSHIAAAEEDLVHDCRVGHLGNPLHMVAVGSSSEGLAAVAVAVGVHEEDNVPNTPVEAVESAADRDCTPRNTVEEDLRV